MAVANTFTTLNGLFKEIYSDRVEDLVPDGMKVQKMIAFEKGEKTLGNLYH